MTQSRDRQTDRRAMEHMIQLNEQLAAAGYPSAERERILVRLLLCFFADDTRVFRKGSFFSYVERELKGDGKDMAALNHLFGLLAGTERPAGPEEDFPVLNRQLFEEEIPLREPDPFFRVLLLNCGQIPWREISPAIFGAMFQEIMDQGSRREWGAHYTSEENIHRLIDPLFLDSLRSEFSSCRGSRTRLKVFHRKLRSLTFLDPACGCGNFLILIYRELRRLELQVIRELYDTSQRVLDIAMYCKVNTDQFFGLEIEGFQADIARIGLWLTERQMDLEAAELFGVENCMKPWIRPVKIRQCNALTTDWSDLIPAGELSCIVGNPPFLGARLMNASQKEDMKAVFKGTRGLGNLDYVSAWYRKAAEYMLGSRVRAAFVSTNSICQGEQAAILWRQLKEGFHMDIDFARKTFVWDNEAGNKAKVHCIIVGFSDSSAFTSGEQVKQRLLFSEEGRKRVQNINAYLADGPDVYVTARRSPLAPVPEMQFGSMANDNGNLVLDPEQRRQLTEEYPETRSMIRPYLGAAEFINGQERHCLWLKDQDPEVYLAVPPIARRIEEVRRFRLRSTRENTRELAEQAHLFGEIRQPESGSYILVPRVSSIRRPYIPMGFVTSRWIASDAVLIIPGGDEAIFALLTSHMHMCWVRTVAGRLKSDFRYSASVVYNNYPFPELTEEQRDELRELGRRILDIRDLHRSESLAELYDPQRMPEDLAAAHRDLDLYVDGLYGCPGCTEEEKLEVLFRLYGEMSRHSRGE